MDLGQGVRGFPVLYLQGMRIMMFANFMASTLGFGMV